ncbi:MAG: SufS family cysteine desulfurase [Candidatus Kerfeldbacteria bacterium]|nr:SufS family cysteine desulfurase [Candidatus Kerfeldbacteria bacterium]
MERILTKKIQQDFPLLQRGVAYLDNASTTQKPQAVLDAMNAYYTECCANVHRGIYAISEDASARFEAVRDQVQQFIGAGHREEIIFTSGTTASLNMIARMLGATCSAGDEIILTEMEHHANLIPWQIVARERGLKLQFLRAREDGEIYAEDLQALCTPRTKIFALTHLSNASGYRTPLAELTRLAHEQHLLVVVDAAQSVPHIPINVAELDIDFLTFSAHKMCGPTGVGVLYGKKALLERLEPAFGGGHMIAHVTLEGSTWAELPMKLEPGTPNIAGIIGFGAALTYLSQIGMQAIEQHIHQLHTDALKKLTALPGIRILGPKDHSTITGILSFAVNGIHPHDIASVLDNEGVAVRAGHHCAQPLMTAWGVSATTRASFYFYNTEEDVNRFIAAIQKTQQLFLP